MLKRQVLQLLVAFALTDGVAGCAQTENQLRVDVITDLAPGVEFQVVRLVATHTGSGDLANADIGARADDPQWLDGQIVATFGERPEGPHRLTATLLFEGSELVERTAVVDVRGSTAALITIARSCVGVTCPGDGDSATEQSCLAGRCVDERCLSGSEVECPMSDCTTAADCGDARSECTQWQCRQGQCLETSEEDRCEAGLQCNPAVGCVVESRCADDQECNDGDPCTADGCEATRFCSHVAEHPGTSCGPDAQCRPDGSCSQCMVDSECAIGEHCDVAAGTCAECLDDIDCNDNDPCTSDRCVARQCENTAEPRCTACSQDSDCDDANSCTDDLCNSGGTCDNTAAIDGTTCPAGECSSGLCAGCLTDNLCEAGTPRCDTITQTCVECVAASDCDDSEECTRDVCANNACVYLAVADDTMCSLGSCFDGACVAPQCDDGRRNGNELGIDCGGSCMRTCTLCETQTEIPLEECRALEALFVATLGASWIDNTGWTTDPNPCSWYGVACSSGHIAQLSLNGNSLGGMLPAEIGALVALERLDVGDNAIRSPLPSEITALTSLVELVLNSNGMTGSLPSDIDALANLRAFVAYENALTGTIPAELGNLSELRTLDLRDNGFTGPLPAELSGLTALTTLVLAENNLADSIPDAYQELLALQWFDLSDANIEGGIPTWFNALPLLHLDLSGNALTGEIPAALGGTSSLRTLDLAGNQLTGTIPTELGNLDQLTTINLMRNQLIGTIPMELGALPLQHVNLSRNMLDGTIPSELTDLSDLVVLDLSVNQLTGQIPSGFGSLSRLTIFNCAVNQLTGPLPDTFGTTTTISELVVANNQLSGDVPIGLMSLPLLRYLDLSANGCFTTADAGFATWLTQNVRNWDAGCAP